MSVGLAMHNTAMLTLPKYMNPWHADTGLVVNAYAPAGQEPANQSGLPQWKHKLPGAISSHFKSQAIKIKTVCPVRFSHCLGKKRGRNNRENGSHPGSNPQEHFSPKTSSISVSVLSQKGTVPDLELFNYYFFFSLHSVSSTSVSMYWFQITLYIYLFIYIFIYNLYQN